VSDAPPLFDGIDTVFYQVCSMDRAIEFYEGVLGLRLLRREGRDWAELQAGDTVLALSGELATRPHQGGATVVLRAPDIAAVDARLAEHGVQRGRIEDMGGAQMLQFFDPDGNEVVALQPPA
jgi:catechol 2,3-dioxygenase-like lactoylglutathione lyase family enzyme